MIQVRLAALSGPDPDPAVWRFRHGWGDVLALGAGLPDSVGESQKRTAFGVGCKYGHSIPERVAAERRERSGSTC